MVVFLGLLALLLSVVFIINSSFLEEYYIAHKMTQMTEMYRLIDDAIKKNLLDTAEMQEKLYRQKERTNISVTVVNANGDVVLYMEQEKRGPLYSQLFGYVLERNAGEVLETGDNYAIYKVRDVVSKTDYLEMYGKMS